MTELAAQPMRRATKALVRLLTQGAPAHGYRTELWTTARVAELIGRQFGV